MNVTTTDNNALLHITQESRSLTRSGTSHLTCTCIQHYIITLYTCTHEVRVTHTTRANKHADGFPSSIECINICYTSSQNNIGKDFEAATWHNKWRRYKQAYHAPSATQQCQHCLQCICAWPGEAGWGLGGSGGWHHTLHHTHTVHLITHCTTPHTHTILAHIKLHNNHITLQQLPLRKMFIAHRAISVIPHNRINGFHCHENGLLKLGHKTRSSVTDLPEWGHW